VSKIAIVAGEPSGDLIASQIMADLKKFNKNIEFVGVGGPKMQQQGLVSFFDYSILSIMGIIDVLKNLKTLYLSRKRLISFLINEKPNIFIGIDAPDFNFHIENKLKKNGARVFHLISPSVWAWRKNRIYYIKKVMHHLFCVFPHEPAIYKKINHSAILVGHTLATKRP
jgi:lipid-A-disaccharide synthase